MKAEKYNIFIEIRRESEGSSTLEKTMKVRHGFGAAGEEVQKILEFPGLERIRVKIEDERGEVTFLPGRIFRLVDIKQRIKSLSFDQ